MALFVDRDRFTLYLCSVAQYGALVAIAGQVKAPMAFEKC